MCFPSSLPLAFSALSKSCHGYVCENYGAPFELPSRGAIGANGLANERDFQYPTAAFEDDDQEYKLINKFLNNFWDSTLPYGPFDVVAGLCAVLSKHAFAFGAWNLLVKGISIEYGFSPCFIRSVTIHMGVVTVPCILRSVVFHQVRRITV